VILSTEGGKNITRRAAGTFEFFLSDKESITGFIEVKMPEISRDRFDELLHAIVTTGKPVIENSSNPTHQPVLGRIGYETITTNNLLQFTLPAKIIAATTMLVSLSLLVLRKKTVGNPCK
jgi:hypothetical protein